MDGDLYASNTDSSEQSAVSQFPSVVVATRSETRRLRSTPIVELQVNHGRVLWYGSTAARWDTTYPLTRNTSIIK